MEKKRSTQLRRHKRTGLSNYKLASNASSEVELKRLHGHCVSLAFMQLTYAASKDFELCDENGEPNPIGKFYRSMKLGTVKPVKGQCSFEFLPDGESNPDWDGCPFGTSNKMNVLNPPTLEAIEKYLDVEPLVLEPPIILAVNAEETPFQKLERILAGMKGQ